MNVEVVQASNAAPRNKNTKNMEPSEDFSKVLSKSTTSEKEDVAETEDIKNELSESTDEQSSDEVVNPLAVFFNLKLIQSKESTLSVVGESTSGSINEIKGMGIEVIPEMKTAGNIKMAEGNNLMMDENQILNQENMLSTQENILLTKEDSIQVDKITIPEIDESSSDIDLKEDIFSNKDISIKEKFAINKQEENPIIKENLIVEENTKAKVTKEKEVADIKDVDISTLDKEFLNTSAREITKTGFQTKVEPTESVLSTENIQRINDSIVEMMETTSEGDTSIMKVKLNPDELGAVNITLKMEDGKLIAKILVDNDYVKQLFANKVNELNESLVKQKIYIEKVDIALNSKSDSTLNQNSNNNTNTNTNAHTNRDSKQGNENYYRKKQFVNIDKELLRGIRLEQINLGSGTISILA